MFPLPLAGFQEAGVRETDLQAAGVFGGVDGRVSLIRLVPIAWSGATPFQNALGKGAPAWIWDLLLHQHSQVQVFGENVCFSARIADVPRAKANK